jgi:UDP-glucose 4-epimerase
MNNKEDNEKIKVLLTGATGFVGQQLLKKLATRYDLRITIRKENKFNKLTIETITIKDLCAETNLQQALEGCKVVIHAAARAHIMKDLANNPLQEFRRVNTEGTLNLAQQAASAGVKRFIFISTIKVNGELTQANQRFTADAKPNPIDSYAISKYEAEQGLQLIAAKTGMEVVIIRPPLIYGPGVKGNFQSMLFWLRKGIPLPLGAIKNKRSLVSLENLNSLIETCIEHPKAANQIFLVSDDNDLSTKELLQEVGQIIKKPVRLLPIPAILLYWGAGLLGKKAVLERLCGSLQVDIDKTKQLLDWKPQQSLKEGLAAILKE